MRPLRVHQRTFRACRGAVENGPDLTFQNVLAVEHAIGQIVRHACRVRFDQTAKVRGPRKVTFSSMIRMADQRALSML